MALLEKYRTSNFCSAPACLLACLLTSHTLHRCPQALAQVGAGSALLVHDAHPLLWTSQEFGHWPVEGGAVFCSLYCLSMEEKRVKGSEQKQTPSKSLQAINRNRSFSRQRPSYVSKPGQPVTSSPNLNKELDGVAAQTEEFLRSAEQPACQRNLLGVISKVSIFLARALRLRDLTYVAVSGVFMVLAFDTMSLVRSLRKTNCNPYPTVPHCS